jgi:hypothetical protein
MWREKSSLHGRGLLEWHAFSQKQTSISFFQILVEPPRCVGECCVPHMDEARKPGERCSRAVLGTRDQAGGGEGPLLRKASRMRPCHKEQQKSSKKSQ